MLKLQSFLLGGCHLLPLSIIRILMFVSILIATHSFRKFVNLYSVFMVVER